MELAPDDVFDGRYRIVLRLGQGARGVVYRARDLAVEPEQADVCLKLLHREAARAGEGLGLRLAFALLGRLHHPNLVLVRRHGTAYGVPYLVSETVDGPRLDRALAGRPVGELLPLATGVARALAFLHGNGHVHQDVKPANVLVAHALDPDLRAWVPKLADLGATHLPGHDPETGIRRIRAGTLAYLSPERLRGGQADARADLWALGVTLFECAAGRVPIDAVSPEELLGRIEAGQTPLLRDVCPEAPAELERVVAWLLAADPRERPADGGEALALLERLVGARDDDLASRTEPAALVGRDRAIARVLTTFGPRATPAPRTVLVAGPAGAGRSRFLDEIAIRAQLAGGRAARVPAGSGLLPWRQALVALGDDPSPTIAADELAERLATTATRAPTVIVVDDLDRRDRLAHELVDRVARSLAGRPCSERSGVLVATGAGATSHDPSVAVAVALLPLDEDAIHGLAASMLAGDPPPALAALLHKDSGGSPAQVVHALRHLLAVGALRRLGGRWDLDDDAAEILGTDGPGDRQLTGQGGAAREVLAALALFGAGARVSLVVLRAVLGGDEDAILAAAQQACAAQLLRVGPDDDGGLVLELRGERVRAACEAAIDPAARARLHARALAALRDHGEGDPLVLGPHALGAGLHGDARVLARAAIAAARARRDPLTTLAAAELALAAAGGDVDGRRAAEVVKARALLELGRIAEAREVALAVTTDAPDSAPAALIAARAAVAFGDAGEAAAVTARLDDLLADGGDPVDPAELAVVRVESARLSHGPHRALELGPAQLALAAAGDPRSRIQLHIALGQAAIAVVDHERARRELEAALALAEVLDDPAGAIDARGWLAALADMAGASDVAMDHVERGLAQAARTTAGVGLARLLNLRGILCIWSGRLDDAADSLIEAERRARVAHGGRLVSSIAGNLVVIHRRRGMYGQALAASLRSLDQKRRLGDKAGMAAAHVNLADVYVELGELDLALAAARRAEAGGRALGHTRAWAQARLAQAAVDVARGDPSAAIVALGEAEPKVDERDLVSVWLTRAAALAALDATAQALDMIDRVLERVRATGDLYEEARARTLRARVTDDDAFGELRRAGDAATRAGARAVAWLAHAELGVRYRDLGLADDAAHELTRARELYDEVTADLPSRHVERYRHAQSHAHLIAAMNSMGR